MVQDIIEKGVRLSVGKGAGCKSERKKAISERGEQAIRERGGQAFK